MNGSKKEPDLPDDIAEIDDYGYEDPCAKCGPWCEHWGGDNICMLAIDEQIAEQEEYHDKYVEKNCPCPICGKRLTCFSIKADELWVWPGDWYNPLIALDIYAVYGAPKGALHSDNNVYHIWTGEGEYRNEKLIRLIGNGKKNAHC